MKKYLIVIIGAVLLYNCRSKINEKDIIGSWKLVEFNTNAPTMSPYLIQLANEEALSSRYSFQTDSIFTLKSNNNLNGNGKFELLKNGTIILHHNDEYNDVVKYKIKSLNSKQMIWYADMGDNEDTHIILRKIKLPR